MDFKLCNASKKEQIIFKRVFFESSSIFHVVSSSKNEYYYISVNTDERAQHVIL